MRVAALARRHATRPAALAAAAAAAARPPLTSAPAAAPAGRRLAGGGGGMADGGLVLLEPVLDERGGDTGVRVLTLNQPDTLNSLTPAMREAFAETLAALAADRGLRALVVTGAGRAFSAGGDFGFIEDRMAGDVDDNERVLAAFYTTFLAVRRLPVVTIAAVQGAAVGGGCGLALACDIRIASTAAKLSLNFVTLGITPGMASSTVLPALTNHQTACRLLLTGDLVGADEALALGLVLQVTPPEDLLPTATALARRVAAAAPTAVAETLAMLREALPWPQLEAAAAREAAAQAVSFKGPDIAEGLAAVRAKRRPQFGPRTAGGGAGGGGQELPPPPQQQQQQRQQGQGQGQGESAGAAVRE